MPHHCHYLLLCRPHPNTSTPQHPITPTCNKSQATPLDEACEVEGKVVCHMGRIRGEEGVSMDKLVHTMQKMTKQMESTKTMDRVTEMMEDVAITLDDAKPLLSQAVELVDQVKPLLDELKTTNLVSNVEVLTRVAAEAAEDIHRLQRLVLDDTNVNALKDAVVCVGGWVGVWKGCAQGVLHMDLVPLHYTQPLTDDVDADVGSHTVDHGGYWWAHRG